MIPEAWDEGMPVVQVKVHVLAEPAKRTCDLEHVWQGSCHRVLDVCHQVGQAVVREGWTDFVGIGRMVLSYWDIAADTLAGSDFQTKKICRTFSDCTTGPRLGLVSGCYPLDDFYTTHADGEKLRALKTR